MIEDNNLFKWLFDLFFMAPEPETYTRVEICLGPGVRSGESGYFDIRRQIGQAYIDCLLSMGIMEDTSANPRSCSDRYGCDAMCGFFPGDRKSGPDSNVKDFADRLDLIRGVFVKVITWDNPKFRSR